MLLFLIWCRWRGRCVDHFYSYIGFGIWLIPRPEGYDPWREEIPD